MEKTTLAKEALSNDFTPPFTYDPQSQLVSDARNRVMCTVRGWEVLSAQRNGATKQDAIGESIAAYLTSLTKKEPDHASRV